MKLHREHILVFISDTLYRPVVPVAVADNQAVRQRVFHNRIAVVLRRDVDTVFVKVFDRVVRSSVAVFQLFGIRAHRERQQLVPKAYPKYRQLADQLFEGY